MGWYYTKSAAADEPKSFERAGFLDISGPSCYGATGFWNRTEIVVSRPGLHKILSVFVTLLLLTAVRSQGAGAPSDEDAYEHNRQGMIAMSKADFEEAIAEFQAAAVLAKDYQITGRPLIYTPVFMTAWANEKIGRAREACREFRHFLSIAPPESVEATKAEHAGGYLKQNCP
jgi:hypothetical protein